MPLPGGVLVTVVSVALVAAGCGSGSGSGDSASGTSASSTSSPPQSATDSVTSLPIGKDDLSFGPGKVASPVGFRPRMVFTLGESWTSVHRYADAFDLALIDSGAGSARAIVVVLTPTEASAAQALSALEARAAAAHATTATSTASIGGDPRAGVDVDGGSGPLVASAEQGIALDAGPGQRLRVLAFEASGHPVLVAVLVPVAATFGSVWPSVQKLLESATVAT